MGREATKPKGKRGNPNWKKGVSGNPDGRPKGAVNKLTAEIKGHIESAAHAAGKKLQQEHPELKGLNPTAAYLAHQASKNPQAFLGLMAKTVPQKIDHEVTVMTEQMAEMLTQRRQQLAEMRRREEQMTIEHRSD